MPSPIVRLRASWFGLPEDLVRTAGGPRAGCAGRKDNRHPRRQSREKPAYDTAACITGGACTRGAQAASGRRSVIDLAAPACAQSPDGRTPAHPRRRKTDVSWIPQGSRRARRRGASHHFTDDLVGAAERTCTVARTCRVGRGSAAPRNQIRTNRIRNTYASACLLPVFCLPSPRPNRIACSCLWARRSSATLLRDVTRERAPPARRCPKSTRLHTRNPS